MYKIEDLKNTVHCADCLTFMKGIPDNSIDSIVTDPPYELGFMGKSWDNTGIANNKEMWAECLRVLKPGGHLLAFAGTRTYHRMASAIEDAGFEVRDMIEWVYGSGFPKSLNIGKAVDKLQGNEREEYEVDIAYLDSDCWGTPNSNKGSKTTIWQKDGDEVGKGGKVKRTKGTSEYEGWGTSLKPAHEPICMARKPLDRWWKIKDDGKKVMGRVMTVAENCLKYGTGGINIDESRVALAGEWDKGTMGTFRKAYDDPNKTYDGTNGTVKFGGDKLRANRDVVEKYGRFPANLLHDNSEEVRGCFPENVKGEIGRAGRKSGGNYEASSYKVGVVTETGFKDNGNASRYFKSILYYPKASKSERNKGCEGLEENIGVGNYMASAKWINDPRHKDGGYMSAPSKPQTNSHPTVKPIALMEYLIKMVTPKNGIVLDPFAGSGSTLVAAKQNGYQYIGIELTEEYIPIIEARLNSPTQDKLL